MASFLWNKPIAIQNNSYKATTSSTRPYTTKCPYENCLCIGQNDRTRQAIHFFLNIMIYTSLKIVHWININFHTMFNFCITNLIDMFKKSNTCLLYKFTIRWKTHMGKTGIRASLVYKDLLWLVSNAITHLRLYYTWKHWDLINCYQLTSQAWFNLLET